MIRSAIYAVLPAENSCYDSPSNEFFADRFVELFPQRRIPAKRIALLPKNEKEDSKNKNAEDDDE